MFQKTKNANRKFWKTAIIAIAAIFIVGTACTQNKYEIVGVWKGRFSDSDTIVRGDVTYYENRTLRGNVTLTINNDMRGIFEFDNGKGSIGSYTVSVKYTSGEYNFIGNEWINRPSGFEFYDLNRVRIVRPYYSSRIQKDIPVLWLKDFQFGSVTRTEEQQAEYEKQKQAQQKTRAIIMYIVGGILLFIFLILPGEIKIIILQGIRKLIIGTLGVIIGMFGIFGILVGSGHRRWSDDR